MADVREQVAGLSDTEVTAVLNRLVEGYAARHPDFPVGDPASLSGILEKAGDAAGESVAPREDKEIRDRAAAARAILVELAAIPDQEQYVAGAIRASRQVLIEPVTTALVMVGI